MTTTLGDHGVFDASNNADVESALTWINYVREEAYKFYSSTNSTMGLVREYLHSHNGSPADRRHLRAVDMVESFRLMWAAHLDRAVRDISETVRWKDNNVPMSVRVGARSAHAHLRSMGKRIEYRLDETERLANAIASGK